MEKLFILYLAKQNILGIKIETTLIFFSGQNRFLLQE